MQDLLKSGGDVYYSKPLFGIAEFIRNNWFLWWRENHNNAWHPTTKPPLLAFFHDAGITHPDDMTSILFEAVWHYLDDKSYDLATTIASLQGYWKEQGYADGKPDVDAR